MTTEAERVQLAQATDRCRTCVLCGHVHDYETPIYRCSNCLTWGQDFYELRPLKPRWRYEISLFLSRLWDLLRGR